MIGTLDLHRGNGHPGITDPETRPPDVGSGLKFIHERAGVRALGELPGHRPRVFAGIQCLVHRWAHIDIARFRLGAVRDDARYDGSPGCRLDEDACVTSAARVRVLTGQAGKIFSS